MTDESDREILLRFLEEVGQALTSAAAHLRAETPRLVTVYPEPAAAVAEVPSPTVLTAAVVDTTMYGGEVIAQVTAADPALIQRVIEIVKPTAAFVTKEGVSGLIGGATVTATLAGLDQLMDLVKLVHHVLLN